MTSYAQPNYYIKYINRAILANLKRRPLKLGRLIVLKETHLLERRVAIRTVFQVFGAPSKGLITICFGFARSLH